MITKICKQCGEEKDLTTEFWGRQKNGKHGFTSRCKLCYNSNNRNRSNSKKPYNRVFMVDGVKHRKCNFCEESKPFDSDHFTSSKRNKSGLGSKCRDCSGIKSTREERLADLAKAREKKTIDKKKAKEGIDYMFVPDDYHKDPFKYPNIGFDVKEVAL